MLYHATRQSDRIDPPSFTHCLIGDGRGWDYSPDGLSLLRETCPNWWSCSCCDSQGRLVWSTRAATLLLYEDCQGGSFPLYPLPIAM